MHFRSQTFTMSIYIQIKFSWTDNGKCSRKYSFWNLSLILILNLNSCMNTVPEVARLFYNTFLKGTNAHMLFYEINNGHTLWNELWYINGPYGFGIVRTEVKTADVVSDLHAPFIDQHRRITDWQ